MAWLKLNINELSKLYIDSIDLVLKKKGYLIESNTFLENERYMVYTAAVVWRKKNDSISLNFDSRESWFYLEEKKGEVLVKEPILFKIRKGKLGAKIVLKKVLNEIEKTF